MCVIHLERDRDGGQLGGRESGPGGHGSGAGAQIAQAVNTPYLRQ
jgi:hypothetical protein